MKGISSLIIILMLISISIASGAIISYIQMKNKQTQISIQTYCGDEKCNNNENCSSCSLDCGNCSTTPSSLNCSECPQPSSWSTCINSNQTRTNYKCDSTANYQCQSYIEAQSCILNQTNQTCPTCFSAGDWSTCINNNQSRTNYRCSAETNYICQSYTETLSCIPQAQTCSDGTQYNQCSANKPKYCINGNLIDNASVCRCPSGYKVTNNTCLSCSCSSWSNITCGSSGCTSNQMYQTRICTPLECDIQSQCIVDAICSIDTTPPTISVSHSPSNPTTSDQLTFTATATDNVGINSMIIYVDGTSVKTCTSSPCTYTGGPYSNGTHTYYATASDAAGNIGRNPSTGTKKFSVNIILCPHVYDHPEVSMINIKIFAFYLVPKDRSPASEWKEKIETLINRAKTFHEEEFEGYSSITYEIFSQPVVGLFTTQEYRDKGYGGWYGAMCGQVIPLKDPSFNSFTSYLVFGDWGQEDSCNAYYVNRCKGNVDISDIKQCGGAGGVYWGNFYNNGYFGCGLVTEEAWKHPEIPGTDTVVYHEGFGHSANMPHSDPLDPNGVMGLAYYNCINLTNSYVESQILNKMISC